MPHLSQKTLSQKAQKLLEKQLSYILIDSSPLKRRAIFAELLSKTEIIMITKRITLIYLIRKDIPTHTIAKSLGMSPSTVARFQRNVQKGFYKETQDAIRRYKNIHILLQRILDITTVPFEHKFAIQNLLRKK